MKGKRERIAGFTAHSHEKTQREEMSKQSSNKQESVTGTQSVGQTGFILKTLNLE